MYIERKINHFKTGCFAIFLFLDPMGSSVYAQLQAYKESIEISQDWQYLLYLPPDYNTQAAKEFPLMLFLHGGGESGSDIELLKKHGPPKLISEGKDFPFIMFSPQNPYKKRLWDEAALMGLLNKILDNYRVDRRRIYLTGMSRGGYGAWRLAIQYPDLFAAMVAISGEAPASYAQWLDDMPIWVFHGEDDEVIPVIESDRMVEQLRKNGNDVRYTRYKNTGHDAWTNTFNNPDLYDWLLKQQKK